jgi:hypothetical protein
MMPLSSHLRLEVFVRVNGGCQTSVVIVVFIMLKAVSTMNGV